MAVGGSGWQWVAVVFAVRRCSVGRSNRTKDEKRGNGVDVSVSGVLFAYGHYKHSHSTLRQPPCDVLAPLYLPTPYYTYS